MAGFAELREHMVEQQIAGRGVLDPAILRAFREVPRELFVPSAAPAETYGDFPLPIGGGQTISQPFIVALMIEAAGVRGGHHVLEVGAGSGYAAALLGRIAERVTAVERDPELAQAGNERLRGLGLNNVAVVHGDGSSGWPEAAPFDAILVSACGRDVPAALVEQLAPGGRLVMPVGEPDGEQRLVRLTRDADGEKVSHEALCPVRFVPLVSGVAAPFPEAG
jgi:protein-L-isoaspartate(D-aspartate) O-methyltransferase